MPAFGTTAPVARRADFGIGKWSRIATYGTKQQRQPDGSSRTFQFDDAAFAQGLANFKRMFAGRGKGMGSDCEHQSLNAPSNGQAAPNPCFFGAMAWIDQAGQLRGMEIARPDTVRGNEVDGFQIIATEVPPPDPAAESERLAREGPGDDPSPAGVWVYCREITPYGLEVIPNYSQLSPLFNDHDVDEQEKDVGFGFQNVSFVNVAFQGGTSFNFSKNAAMGQYSDRSIVEGAYPGAQVSKQGRATDGPYAGQVTYALWLPGGNMVVANVPSEAAAWQVMADRIRSRNGKMNEDMMPPEMMAKLAKFGMIPDKPETCSMAFEKYMDETDDMPDMRKAMRMAYQKMMAKMGTEPQSGGVGMLPDGEPNATPPMLAAPGQMGGMPMVPDADKDGMAKMAKLIAPILAPLQERVVKAESAAAAAMSKLAARDTLDKTSALAAFRKEMLEGETARFLPEQAAQLDTIIENVGGDIAKARQVCEYMPPAAAFTRWTSGGNPVGLSTVPPPGLSGMSKTQAGFAFNKAVREFRAAHAGVSFADAQAAVAAEQPDLYRNSL